VVKIVLGLHNLDARHPGVTPGIAASYSEAVRVCLGRHHSSPVDLNVERSVESKWPGTSIAQWDPPDEKVKRAWANAIDATEAGAYCVALATMEWTDDLVAISRAETRTGADYYLIPKGQVAEDLEASCRLEVSGVDKGDVAAVKARLKQKIVQALAGQSNLPAIAAVVGFSCRQVAIADVIDQ
jgi:hypothetical protein